MKSLLLTISLVVAGLSFGLAPIEAEAKRLGGGKAAGMQRQAPAKPADASPAANAAAPAAAGAAAAAGKRSWMGPLAGLAAGLGLAALFSHLGMGEGLANVMMMVLLAAVAFFVIRWAMRRFGGAARQSGNGLQLAGAGAAAGSAFGGSQRSDPTLARSSLDAAPVATSGGAGPAPNLPDGMPAAEFERVAKMVFIRLQAANDAGDLNDLRAFTTPEMFAAVKLDLQDRGPTAQRTDVVRVDAEVLDVASETDSQVVSVRFHGLIREQTDGVAEPFDEIWHLVKPADGSREWAIAGIQQSSPPLAQAA